MAADARNGAHTFIVEHLDPEMGPWSLLEYQSIAEESALAGAAFYLSSVPKTSHFPPELKAAKNLTLEHRSVEDIYSKAKHRVCLLDPAAEKELSPQDGNLFDAFLFGGILGKPWCINNVVG